VWGQKIGAETAGGKTEGVLWWESEQKGAAKTNDYEASFRQWGKRMVCSYRSVELWSQHKGNVSIAHQKHCALVRTKGGCA